MEDADRYASLFARVRSAFQHKFVAPNGMVGEGTQTAYVLALDFDLVPEPMRSVTARYLADDIRARGHLTTGFLGTPHLLTVLSRFGYINEAYMLLTRQEFPSWLYPVVRGATTIWERWDGIKPDGTFQDPGMNSFNHYAYGAVGEWIYRVIAGINPDPADPGFHHSIIAPHPGGGLTHAEASVETVYGLLSCRWEITRGVFTMALEVPPNTQATVHLPYAKLSQLREGNTTMRFVRGIYNVHDGDDSVVVEIGSGRYTFSYPSPVALNSKG
jgi:alpha-L-rhamnosidase